MLKRVKNNIITAEKKYDVLKKWTLAVAETDGEEFEFSEMKDVTAAGITTVPANVPGNFELDLYSAGIIKKDPYTGDGCLELSEYEYSHIFYSCIFEWNTDDSKNAETVLFAEGIDTVADIYLNGERLGGCDNMLIEHSFKISSLKDGKNEIFIHIKPTILEARAYADDIGSGSMSYSYESLYIRKAAHMFGWDIAPRAVSGGIWKPIYIKTVKRPGIKETYLIQGAYNADTKIGTAHLRYILDIENDRCDKYRVIIDGKCGDSEFHTEHKPWFVANRVGFEIENCKLWNVHGNGVPNLYDVTVTLLRDGVPCDRKDLRFGFRELALINSETIDDNGNGEFRFYINGKPIYIMGTNHVPADMFHSKDKERIPKILKLAADCGCNMIRCWGGNVYEDDLFYDMCDELGIAVWQDFGMACGTYPQDERMQKMIADEAAAVIKRLRQHPCICIWAGDNECDIMQMRTRDPNLNILTRNILPQAVNTHDGTRPYLPSSPYVSKKAHEIGCDRTTEQHLWGPRDWFKGDYYAKANACFVSEIGYHGCPSPTSIYKFIDGDAYPFDNKQCILHCSSPEYPNGEFTYRNELMKKQVERLFGRGADNVEEFAAMSQISQAEADKFFIERFRIKKDKCGGVIWWNIIDCWPQFSDSVVDYYFVKKLAYHYITLSQQQFLCAMDDTDGTLDGWAINDYPFDVECNYKIVNTESGKTEFEGACTVSENGAIKLFSAEKPTDNIFYKIEWNIKPVNNVNYIEKTYGINHYSCFDKTIDFEHYIEMMSNIPEYKFEGFSECVPRLCAAQSQNYTVVNS